MNESSHGVAFKGHSRNGQQSWAGVFLSLRKEGIKETYNVISLTDAVDVFADLQDGFDDTDWYSQFLLHKLSLGG